MRAVHKVSFERHLVRMSRDICQEAVEDLVYGATMEAAFVCQGLAEFATLMAKLDDLTMMTEWQRLDPPVRGNELDSAITAAARLERVLRHGYEPRPEDADALARGLGVADMMRHWLNREGVVHMEPIF